MEALDTERLRERTELESQVNSLRQTHLDSQVRIMCCIFKGFQWSRF